ncbi:MAG: insulinase family protein [Candidatus Riflebacteria bacterium]|nr:insulinase family protein [Candidatus Riflebacteria bacterium]
MPVLFERLDHLHSVTIGVWVLVGSRHESGREQGISHLVEHMLFKGTGKRNAREIAEALEFVGGEINAFTSREYSCYWAKSSTEHFTLAADVLSDLLINSLFDPEEYAKERKVILAEIKMYEDSPEELGMDLLSNKVFDEHLGHPIVGTTRIVRELARDDVLGYYRRMYGPKDMFITVVGNVPASRVKKEMQAFTWPRGTKHQRVKAFPKASLRRGVVTRKKKIEQAHVAIAYGGLPIAAPERYVLHVINAHLGTGMSSVLFQEVREKRGLAYNVYTFVQSYKDIGLLGVYCGTGPSKVKDVLQIVRQEVDRLLQDGLPERRLIKMKEQLKGNLLLSLEKPSFRMTRLGVCHHYFGRILPVEEIVTTIDGITSDQVAAMAQRVFGPGYYAASGVGPFSRTAIIGGLGGTARERE